MLSNIHAAESLLGVARAKGRDYETKTVHPKLVEESQVSGWTIEKKHKRSVRLRRPKGHGALLEDRVWMLLYRMGFAFISGAGGAFLELEATKDACPKNQIDVLAVDDEVAIAIECKSSAEHSKRPQFQEELAKFAVTRQALTNSVRVQFPAAKRQFVFAMFLSKITLTATDIARASAANVAILDEHNLAYYENLVSHLGPAARYQFLADLLPGKAIPGLAIRVPAVKTKMGGANCYTFSISPAYLLKISYVSHRSKGKASDVNTYQRMIKKARLVRIREYINDDGLFPTNIVLNLDKGRLKFERIRQEGVQTVDTDAGTLGWLDIRPAYKSAWIIDGQHRLYAYSGLERAHTSKLSVLAFEGLLPSKQAELFIDINAKQKSVKQSLLQELYAELHWDAAEDSVRVGAIVSKAIQVLDEDPDSALRGRIQKADEGKDVLRCISLTSMYSAVERTEFHIAKEKKGHVLEYGPLWAGDNNDTLKRTVHVLKGWFNIIRAKAPDWWDKGAGEGGGLAMNDGVITCINVLRSVFQHLDAGGARLIHRDEDDLLEAVKCYGEAVGDYLGGLTEQERKGFRDLRGIQGQTARTRRCQQAIHERIPSFNPPGLEEFSRQEKAQTNAKAKEIIDRIETTLQRVVIEELRSEFGPEEPQWWILGVPKTVRLRVTQRFEEEDGRRGGKEYYLDLIDYKTIALQNWEQFEPLLGYGKKSQGKDKRTHWLTVVNERRKVVAHASSAVTLSLEELAELQEYDRWLRENLAGREATEN